MSVTGHIIGNWNLSGEVNETGEGSSVVPNPPGDPTDSLTKIEIDDVVYSITGNQIQSDWTQSDTSAVDYIKNKPSLSTVATSGSYDDLTDKPTIPTIEANPAGAATDTLTKINIDGSIYNIPSGGGSSITLTKLTTAQYEALTPAQKADPSIIYFIDDPVNVLDPNYTYHTAVSDQIVVRVYHEGEADQHIVWFFNGFEKTNGDVSVPATLSSYVPTLSTSVTSQAMSPTSSEASYDYWIGWSRSLGTGVIRSWNSSWESTVGGTFWAVVDNDGGDEQVNEYASPYVYITDHSDNYIYYQGIRYDDTSAENVSYDNTVSGLTATNVQGAVDEIKSNLTQLNGLTVYRNLTPQTSYASFNDGSNLPLISLTTSIDPIQDLHGYDNPWVGGAGKNKYEGSPLFDEYVNKNKWTLQAEKYNSHDVYKKSTAWGGMYKIKYLDVGTYTFSCMCKTSDFATVFIFLTIDNVTTAITNVNQISNTSSTSWTKISGTFNVTSAGTVAIRVERSNDNGDIYISEYQLESGSTATAYEPYSNICPISGFTEANVSVSVSGVNIYDGQTYNIQFKDGDNPLTVYGGTLDVVSGVLTITDGYIASYNSEALPSTWISDRDVYAEGTTPTVGAEVVYKLATPQTYQLTPTEVNSLLGQNYIFSDTGNITNVKYIGVLNFS